MNDLRVKYDLEDASVNSILDSNDNLAVKFEAKIRFMQVPGLSSVFVGTVDTILPGRYPQLMFSLDT